LIFFLGYAGVSPREINDGISKLKLSLKARSRG